MDATMVKLTWLSERVEELEAEAERLIVGRAVRVRADINEQPFGLSKPSLKGKAFVVAAVFLTPVPSVWLKTEKGRILGVGVAITDVEFIS